MLLALLLVLGACDGAHFGDSYPRGDDQDDADLYDRHYEEAVSSSTAMILTKETQYTRIRRNQQTSPVRTLSPDEIRKVKGVLKDLISGRDVQESTEVSVTDLKKLMDLMTSSPSFDLTRRRWAPNSTDFPMYPEDALRIRFPTTEYVYELDHMFIKYRRMELWYPSTYFDDRVINMKGTPEERCLRLCAEYPKFCLSIAVYVKKKECHIYNFAHYDHFAQLKKDSDYNYYVRIIPTTTPTPTTLNTTTSTEMTTLSPKVDINALVQIIADLTMNTIESNLTDLFNATLQKYGIPLCPETSTTEEPTYDFANATIISKCFVCGMDTPGIPRNAYCADAFAGDFLPLVPVDPKARGQIARYRKYCRYLDVNGMITNETQPRSVFGRWTGGCSVRWVDLSGVYTQRACRNRRRATTGLHYVSKRMAKLEMALKNEDNGCIISPMSSLVPLSRGISLYARFHACVCTGSWCNVATCAYATVAVWAIAAVARAYNVV